MEECVRQGWHTGGPAPYGYLLEAHPHPNPNKAREGKRKHRLILDPVRAPVVLMIFEDYCMRLLGLGEICEKLNRDLDRYPPPTPTQGRERARPTWSRSQIHAMLRNPKYTGYNVWGRHDKRPGRPASARASNGSGAPSQPTTRSSRRSFSRWSRSARQQPQRHAGGTRRARATPRPTRGARSIRSAVACAAASADDRMEGTHQKGSNWYRCQFVQRRSEAAADPRRSPPVLGIKEDTSWTRSSTSLLVASSARTAPPPRRRTRRSNRLDLGSARADRAQRLDGELAEINRSLRAQTLRLEEHEDPSTQSSRSQPTDRRTQCAQERRHRRNPQPRHKATRRPRPVASHEPGDLMLRA